MVRKETKFSHVVIPLTLIFIHVAPPALLYISFQNSIQFCVYAYIILATLQKYSCGKKYAYCLAIYW